MPGGPRQPPQSRATVPNANATNAQSMKVRRLEQTLFLREMERLADAMCRHYIEARPEVDAVAPEDIRGHVDNIHDRVHHAIQKDLMPSDSHIYRGLEGATAIPLEDFADEATRHGFGPGSSTGAHSPGQASLRDSYQPQPRRQYAESSPAAGARPHAPREQWTAQEARGVSLRLRHLAATSVQTQAQYRANAHPQRTVIEPDEPPLLTVNRFPTEADGQLALLDMNMDNNTVCLSARKRPNAAKNSAEMLTTAMRTRTEQSWGDSHKPRRPVRFPREKIPPEPGVTLEAEAERAQAALIASTSSGSYYAGGGATAASGSQSARVTAGGKAAKPCWSPRDAIAMAAQSPRTARVGSGQSSKLPAIHRTNR